MRTAHRAWLGAFAAVFLLVAMVDCSGNDQPNAATSTAPIRSAPAYTPQPAPPRDPMLGRVSDDTAGVAKTVRRVVSIGDVEYTDGTVARLNVTPYSKGASDTGWEKCADRVRLAAAHRLLDGKTVTAGRDHTVTYTDRTDWIRIAYAPYASYSGETDYTSALSNETTTKIMDECYPKADPAPTSDTGSDVYVDGDNNRDGAFTGGYCSRKRWC